MTNVDFEVLDGAAPRHVTVAVEEVLLAGYTGRERAAVLAHIEELRTLGVAPPPRVPMVYVAPPTLLTTDSRIQVRTSHTSGEAEFVLVQTPGGLLVGVGSDHTDRQQEAIDVAQSKRACPKVLSRQLWRHTEVAAHWDQLEICAWITSDGNRRVYQQGTLAAFMGVDELLGQIRQAGHPELDRRIIFGGTLAVEGGFVYGERFECRLHDPVLNRFLSCDYAVSIGPLAEW
jgi:hypothetical protein